VSDLLITVLIVKKTELMLKFRNVHVHLLMEIMKFHYKLIVHHVAQDVTLVLNITFVKSVNLTLSELIFQIVIVLMDIMKKVGSV
jgi:hypothetical protein